MIHDVVLFQSRDAVMTTEFIFCGEVKCIMPVKVSQRGDFIIISNFTRVYHMSSLNLLSDPRPSACKYKFLISKWEARNQALNSITLHPFRLTRCACPQSQ